MLNKALLKQTLVAILLRGRPALADPPAAWAAGARRSATGGSTAARTPCAIAYRGRAARTAARCCGSRVAGAARRARGRRRRCRSTCRTGSRSRSATEPAAAGRLADLRRGRLRGDRCRSTPSSRAALRRERGGSATFTLVDGVRGAAAVLAARLLRGAAARARRAGQSRALILRP